MRSGRATLSHPKHRVVSEDKISWPTRGPNIDRTIGSTMRRGLGDGQKSACI
jgi:hypothetical protein